MKVEMYDYPSCEKMSKEYQKIYIKVVFDNEDKTEKLVNSVRDIHLTDPLGVEYKRIIGSPADEERSVVGVNGNYLSLYFESNDSFVLKDGTIIKFDVKPKDSDKYQTHKFILKNRKWTVFNEKEPEKIRRVQ